MSPEQVILHIAKAAQALGWQAGVGASETAGAIVSYLAQNPARIGAFFANEEGVSDWPDFVGGGCLTWHASDGRIIHPADYRAARAAKEDTAS